jgi:hypothetical protein
MDRCPQGPAATGKVNLFGPQQHPAPDMTINMKPARRHSLYESLINSSRKPKTNRASIRRLLGEPLESRILMAADPVMNYVLKAVDANNNPITEVYVGDTFRLIAQVQDVRTSSPGRYGVMAGYLDVRYNPSIADSPTKTITHASPYTNLPTGTAAVTSATTAIIDNAGGFTGLSGLERNTLYTLWSMEFVAQAPGVITFAGEPTTQNPNDATDPFGRDIGDDAQSPGSWTLMYGRNDPVAPAGTSQSSFGAMGFVNTTLTVKQGLKVTGDSATVDEDSTANRINVLTNDTVSAGDSKQITAYTLGGHGLVTKSDNDTPDDTNDDYLLYTPAANYVGTDTFTYTATDGHISRTATVTVTMSPVNDPPTVAIAGTSLTTAEDTPLSLVITVADIDADASGGVRATVSVANGTLQTAASSANVTGKGTSSVVVTGLVADVKAALNGLVYTPASNFNGSDTVTAVVNDLGHTGSGGQLSASASSGLTVTAVNDAPSRVSGSLTPLAFDENSAPSPVSVGLNGLVYGPGGAADESTQTLSCLVTAVPSFVQLFKADGVTAVKANTLLTMAEFAGLKYKTTQNLTGTGSLGWSITDNGSPAKSLAESVTFTITAVNDPPVRTAGTVRSISVREDSVTRSAASLGLSGLKYGPGGGKDEAGQTLSYRITSIPAGILVFKSDGKTQVLAGSWLSYTELKGLKYKTAPNATGTGALTWTVTDNGSPARSLTESQTLTITAVNDVPARTSGVLTPIRVVEDSASSATSLGLTSLAYGPGGGADETGQTLTRTLAAVPAFVQLFKEDGTTQVGVGSVLTGEELAKLKYKTVSNTNGTGNITWKVADNGSPALSLTETLSIAVTAVNDAPVRTAGTLTPVSVLKDSANTTAVTAGLNSLNYGAGGGQDELRQRLKYTVTAIPDFVMLVKSSGAKVVVNATLSINDLRGLKYKTIAGRTGTGNLAWTVTDSGSPAMMLAESLSIEVKNGSALLPATTASQSKATVMVSHAEIQPLVDAAISRWAAAGLDPGKVAMLSRVPVTIADLGSQGYLGYASQNQVVIDDNGADLGWFIDVTPNADEEFAPGSSSPAASRMDLLTVVMHEMGHVIGLGDLDVQCHADQLMAGTLGVGQRRLPASRSIAERQSVVLIGPSAPTQGDVEAGLSDRRMQREYLTDLAMAELDSFWREHPRVRLPLND